MMKKNLYIAFWLLATSALAQKSAPINWQNLDLKKDKYPGVSTEKAYNELLTNKTGKKIIVAVIDGGTEVAHEDLKNVIWTNPKEVAGNGIDDDNNGYIDDVNGWNFIGGKDSNVAEDSYEVTRVYAALKERFTNTDTTKLSGKEKKDYFEYVRAKQEYEGKYAEASRMVELLGGFANAIEKIKKETGSNNPTMEQLNAFKPGNLSEVLALHNAKEAIKRKVPLDALSQEFAGAVNHYGKGMKYGYNTEFNPRSIVGDNYADVNERYYGNNRVSSPNGEHGSHVAGIIGASRKNGIGMDGVADHVSIMVLRAVPDGDERDKDVANAIRYAADNGASIINMSFGKSYSPDKKAVDDAIRYAISKDVLLIHAAGNDGANTDIKKNYPKAIYEDGTRAEAWIEVGASSWRSKKHIAASFSNYGKETVDLFAPGEDIYSCVPESKYATYDGTSMAAPVTAGVAALVRSYYPQLTALQVKDILMKSVTPVKGKVIMPSEKKKKAKMKDLCVSGGIVNAYAALKLAEQVSIGKK